MNIALDQLPYMFTPGPPHGLLTRLGLRRRSPGSYLLAAAGLALIAWFPLLLLTFVQDGLTSNHLCRAFLADATAHTRFLIVVPLLLIADLICTPRLGLIVQEFQDGGLIREQDRAKYQAAVASTAHLVRSRTAEVVILLLSYALVAWLSYTLPDSRVPAWYWSDTSSVALYPWAVWWHSLVSLPLLFSLLLGWLWRLIVWTRFLVLMTRLDLRLVASHPDLAGGLGFVGTSLRMFSIVALAYSAFIAGPIAKRILVDGVQSSVVTLEVAIAAALVVVLFTSPLVVLAPSLRSTWWNGRAAYQGMARRMGDAFEIKWFGCGKKQDAEALKAADFSALTDYYAVAANVDAMRFVPVDLKSIVILALGAVAPFLVITILAMPTDVLVERLKGFLL